MITTYGAAGMLPPAHPCAVGMPPHVEPVGRLWDEADLVIAVGSDLDGVQTQNFAQPQPPRLVAINLDAADATKNYRADVSARVRRRRRHARQLRRAGARPRRRSTALAERLHGVRADACGTLDARALRFLDAIRFAVPDDGSWSRTCASPATGWPASTRRPHPRKLQIPLGWGTLGYAFPAALGAALAGRRAGGRGGRRRRLPLRAPASSPRSRRSASR